ncbi:hypothetical protein [Erythrobacter sp. CCH5-A1]|jgi:hypothetical protein|uniref:hypothetical protein n=1 Tax=Erythrobacter sp. CCH5-A1 TaxID=1768792 RepID=UPI0012E3D2C3|nr:hypothetical protein [Erythrobacter sp. CCH5-A1]
MSRSLLLFCACCTIFVAPASAAQENGPVEKCVLRYLVVAHFYAAISKDARDQNRRAQLEQAQRLNYRSARNLAIRKGLASDDATFARHRLMSESFRLFDPLYRSASRGDPQVMDRLVQGAQACDKQFG